MLPQKWQPSQDNPLPPVTQPLAEIEIPDAFIGCWRGRPNGFDRVYFFSPDIEQIGEPGDITFCYRKHSVEVPRAEVYISPAGRARDLTLSLGLAHQSFTAHGIKTDVYSVNAAALRARTTLDVDPTLHLFHVIPMQLAPEPSQVDWHAAVIDAQTIRIEAYQVLWAYGKPMFSATWHADFARIFDSP